MGLQRLVLEVAWLVCRLLVLKMWVLRLWHRLTRVLHIELLQPVARRLLRVQLWCWLLMLRSLRRRHRRVQQCLLQEAEPCMRQTC